jgi:uncharacterized protein YbjT (DUF2867 family)
MSTTDADLRGLTHNETYRQAQRDRGVEDVVDDFLKLETLGPALEGVSTVLLLIPIAPHKVPQTSNVIRVAKEQRFAHRYAVG